MMWRCLSFVVIWYNRISILTVARNRRKCEMRHINVLLSVYSSAWCINSYYDLSTEEMLIYLVMQDHKRKLQCVHQHLPRPKSLVLYGEGMHFPYHHNMWITTRHMLCIRLWNKKIGVFGLLWLNYFLNVVLVESVKGAGERSCISEWTRKIRITSIHFTIVRL